MNLTVWKKQALPLLQSQPDYQGIDEFWLQDELDRLAEDLLFPEGRPGDYYLPAPELTEEDRQKLDRAFERLLRGEPIPYITGFTWFFGMKIFCFPEVLIPRPDTELLVTETVRRLAAMAASDPGRPLEMTELCFGSGCVSLAADDYFRTMVSGTPLRILAADLSPACLEACRYNIHYHKAETRVFPELADLWPEAVKKGLVKPDLVAANPPYLTDAEWREAEALHAEPELALAAGPDGLGVIRRIIAEGAEILAAGTPLLLEHGLSQAEAVRALAEESGAFCYEALYRDMAGRPRVSALKRI